MVLSWLSDKLKSGVGKLKKAYQTASSWVKDKAAKVVKSWNTLNPAEKIATVALPGIGLAIMGGKTIVKSSIEKSNLNARKENSISYRTQDKNSKLPTWLIPAGIAIGAFALLN